jgi:hypothetical protein
MNETDTEMVQRRLDNQYALLEAKRQQFRAAMDNPNSPKEWRVALLQQIAECDRVIVTCEQLLDAPSKRDASSESSRRGTPPTRRAACCRGCCLQ